MGLDDIVLNVRRREKPKATARLVAGANWIVSELGSDPLTMSHETFLNLYEADGRGNRISLERIDQLV